MAQQPARSGGSAAPALPPKPASPKRPPANTHKLLYIMRGLPGSGKSTMCQQLVSYAGSGAILGTDDFFTDPATGAYKHDRTRLVEAHVWNQARVLKAMQSGVTPICVDNTHAARWEARFYVVYGLRYGYQIVFQEPSTAWWRARDLDELARRNKHGVSRALLAEMAQAWDDDFTLQSVLWAQPPPAVAAAAKAAAASAAQLLAEEAVSAVEEAAVEEAASAADAAPDPAVDPVAMILAMGFPRRAVSAAMDACCGNVDRALALLLDTDVTAIFGDDAAPPPVSPIAASQVLVPRPPETSGDNFEALVGQLLSLGVRRDAAVAALERAQCNVEQAASYLFP